ncbi:hypothetical protein [Serratia marcescens]|uniref:hypothetical protein n=1 Tax=Serratia marcescens TaxID=615 RepID=UPI00148D821A|nr:hypothetical protein [Serratia marcescens]QJU42278.1 hypothetical protein HMI62_24465 [Serratia marcescens]
MKVQQKSGYYVSRLCVKSVLAGKVKKKTLKKCLKAVSNSVNKMGYGECDKSIRYLKELLSSHGSKIMDKKLELLDSILAFSVKKNCNIDDLQHCMIEMRFKREFLWRNDFGVGSERVSLQPNDDLARKLKFNLLKWNFLAMEKKVISGIERNLSQKHIFP